MALTAYQNATVRLLQNPAAPSTLYATADITTWINAARQQLASEGDCIAMEGTIATVSSQRGYNFSGISSFTPGNASAVTGPLHVESLAVTVTGGKQKIWPRPYAYFENYYLSQPSPVNGTPLRWAQLYQGNQGTFVLDPPPDQIYTLTARMFMLPITLASDSDPEAIPYPWTDAIPYYAAYLALLSAQSPSRISDAQRYFNVYSEYVTRARQYANADIVRHQYIQAQDPTLINKLGVQKAAGGGGG